VKQSGRFQPVVIIGAPRSGTNMLRDALSALPGWATWPCDEINYAWRHGNLRVPSDELTPEMATAPVRRQMQQQFDWVHARYHASVVVEKTCANSLRVPFVDAVLPNARYIFIVRNGIDVVGSAIQRWTAPADVAYLARKARFVPRSDLPYYATRYFANRVYRIFSRDRRVAFWGPQMQDLQALLARHTLDEVCAIQWQRCVDASADAFAAMPQSRWVEVSYEQLVANPMSELTRVTGALGFKVSGSELQRAATGIGTASVGKGRQQMGEQNVARLSAIVGDTLRRFQYA